MGLLLALAACQGTQATDERGDTNGQKQTTQSLPPSVGPVVLLSGAAQRQGRWEGGPEPVSGKLRSGITSYYQTQSGADGALTLVLRLEDVDAADATVQLRTSDGAKLLSPGSEQVWPLRQGAASQWTLSLSIPPGDSYLHVLSAQRGRHSTRTLLLHRDGVAAAPLAGAGTRVERDASGQSIVRQQAVSASAR